jgi:hypothetical protein
MILNQSKSKATADFALALAGAGYAVLPVLPNKHPACPHGHKDATADLALVAHMFRESGAPLIGIATGAPSSVAVLDLDGEDGLDWLAAHRADIPATVEVTTRRRGRHLWYALPAGCEVPPSTVSRIAPHVDTRGEGGYCVAWAPSALLDRTRLAHWPGWLSDLLHPPPLPRRPVAVRFAAGGADAERRYAVAALRSAVERVAAAREGTRNNILNREAFAVARLVGRGLVESEVRDALAVAGRVAGLTPRAIDRTLSSALRARGGRA